MVYFDNAGHMIADTKEELHAFAKMIGLKREWYQEKGELSHYDLTNERMRLKAARCGAVKVSPKEIVRKLKNQVKPVAKGVSA
jgi:hypothetical protein